MLDSKIEVAENNWKQNPDDSYTKKYQKHNGCGYGYKLVFADDKFSKSFKILLRWKRSLQFS